jgi:hypothetical protein
MCMRAKLGTCLNASVRVSTLQGQKPNTELILMHTVLGQIWDGWGMVWEEGMRQGEHLWGVAPKTGSVLERRQFASLTSHGHPA